MDWKSQQNPDGGWAYGLSGSGKRTSWTEPTVLVLLAQSVNGMSPQGGEREIFAGGMRFLRSMEGRDGGFRPQPEVRESTWVTAVAALLPEETLGAERYRRAIDWLKGQTGRESGWSFQLQQRLQGNKADYPRGWPWFPGAAAWVIPTSLGMMAFDRALTRSAQFRDDRELKERLRDGRKYLLSRMCADGGWNHGSNEALGFSGDSYPETTGIALAALKGLPLSPQLEKGKAAARRHLASCRTAEGIAWLRIGLAAQGEKVRSAYQPVCRTVMDEALMVLAENA